MSNQRSPAPGERDRRAHDGAATWLWLMGLLGMMNVLSAAIVGGVVLC